MLSKVDHIDIAVPNLDKTLEFFKSMGFIEIRRTNPERQKVEMSLPGEHQVVFEIAEDRNVDSTVVMHIAFSTEDVEKEADRIRKIGLPIATEPHLSESGRITCNVADPNGKKWQLTNDLPLPA